MTAPTIDNPATDKQLVFLNKLVQERDVRFTIGDSLTTVEASDLIKEALDAPRRDGKAVRKTAPAPAAPSLADLSLADLLELAAQKARFMGV